MGIDTVTRRVFIGGREVSLTPTETTLLYAFAQLGGETVQRDQLSALLWNDRGDGHRIVVLIHSIRAKLRPFGCADYIETVKMHGYRWHADVIAPPPAPKVRRR